jgi:hypothetical protein
MHPPLAEQMRFVKLRDDLVPTSPIFIALVSRSHLVQLQASMDGLSTDYFSNITTCRLPPF